MSVWNVFDPDAFSFQTLTAAINNLPFVPKQIADMGIFDEQGQPNLQALIDEVNETIELVAVKSRGAPPQVVDGDKGKVYDFTIPHLPEKAYIAADSVQGVRELGTENNSRTVESERNKRLAKMRKQIDLTIEWHRLQALMGNYIDVNGTATSLFTKFGVSQVTTDFALNSSSTKVRSKCLTVQTSIEDNLGGLESTGIVVLCGATFWDNLITHPAVEATYLNTQMAAALRTGLLNTLVFGDLEFRRYRGSSTVKIPVKEAYAIPMGVENLCLTRFAPGNYIEAVNTIGLPYYAKARENQFGTGVDMQAQSNPLNIVTRPHAIIKLTTP